MAAGTAKSYFSSVSSSVEKTPQKVREKCDRIITDLNLRYGLNLPKQHGVAPQTLMKSRNSREQHISNQIRFLSWRSNIDVSEVIQDFEEWAKGHLSEWIYKPSQEPGTLVSQSITTSFIRDGVAKVAASFTKEQKEAVLKDLERRLREECDLVNSSEVYERQSTKMEPPPIERAVGRRKAERPSQTNKIDSTLKRKKPSSGSQDVSPSKRQPPSYCARKPSDGGLTEKSSTNFSANNLLSFTTTASSDNSKVFTEPNSPEPESTTTTFDTADVTAHEAGSEAALSQDLCPDIAHAYDVDEEFRRSIDEKTRRPTNEDLSRSINEGYGDSFELLDQIDDASPTGKFLQELSTNGPLQEIPGLWKGAPLRNRWEIHRASVSLDMASTELIAKEPLRHTKDRRNFWQSISSFPGVSPRKMPERSSPRAWDQANGRYEDPKMSVSVVLSGAMAWRGKSRAGLFDLTLHPLKLERSCRFHRHFGSDRFLVLQLPSLSTHDLPPHLQKNAHDVRAAVSMWLHRTIHLLLGRQWRAFYVEEMKRASKAEDPRGYKVHFFAVDGDDFAIRREGIGAINPRNNSVQRNPISLETFLNWHIPFADNQNSTDCKLFQRLALGLSRTYTTMAFEAAEFIWLKDGDPVTNDGCARISQTAANKIASQLNLQSTPSVFQGRIAGAKGVWMVEKDDKIGHTSERSCWIEISDSQLKILPHPRDKPDADIAQRTFEVTEWSRPPRVASVTKQLIMILHDRGVPLENLERLMLAEMHDFSDKLKGSMSDCTRLRAWIQTAQRHSRSFDGIQYRGRWPINSNEQVISLVDSGFMPKDCPALLEHLRSFLYEYFDRYIDKLAIKIPQTTDVYCIADPYGILADNEVHLGFSEPWPEPISGHQDNILDGFDVLVARSPALLPSDIQRRKASWKRELRHFKDVIVFPTKGTTPLASMLSGGDYDGDRVWVCWDQTVVLPFRNASLPIDPPPAENCGMTQVSRKISSIFKHQRSTEEATNDFLESCFRFNLNPGLLGLCTNQHEKLVYHDSSLSTPGAIKLATLAGYLVDRSKQGLLLSTENWQKIQRETGCSNLQKPAYKSEVPPKVLTNIIDRLKFNIAVPQKERVLTEFSEEWPQRAVKDPDLTKPMGFFRLRKAHEKSLGHTSPAQEILEDLDKRLSSIIDQWDVMRGKLDKEPQGFFDRVVQNLCDMVQQIEPVHPDHPMVSNCGWEPTSFGWRSLRASYVYEKASHRNLSWYVVGPELCELKVQALKARKEGWIRQIHPDIFEDLHVDVKRVRRRQEREEDEFEEPMVGEDPEDLD